jgi:uncharacterized protein
MKPYPWLKLIKKSRVEPDVEPPFWLGNHSNGEYFHEQTPRERLIRQRILEQAEAGARKHGIDRRQFLASSMGVATSLAAINWVAACAAKENPVVPRGPISGGAGMPSVPTPATPNGRAGAGGAPGVGGASGGSSGVSSPVSNAGGTSGGGGVGGVYTVGEPMDLACTDGLMLNAEQEFVFDLQTHHVERVNSSSYMSFLRSFQEQSSCGMDLAGCFSRQMYMDLLFLQSNTTLAMLSAVPAIESELILTNDDMMASRDSINQLAHSQRVVIQGQVLPNDNLQKQLDGMHRLVDEVGIVCWKVHTEWGPGNVWGNAPNGYWLDDEEFGIPFIEKARETGVKAFCCHKGLPAPLFNSEYCSPRDIGPVAKAYPDTHWVVYHSAFGFGGGPFGGGEGAYQDGSMSGIDSMITMMKDNGIGPNQNVYAELAGVWNAVMTNPTQAAHIIGKLLLHVGENNLLWGSDAIWTARPQPYVESFWNFEITQEFQDMYGYPALTPEIKRKVLGLNSARVFNIDPVARRCKIEEGAMASLKRTLDGEFGPLQYFGERPLGPTTRREFAMLSKLREFLKVPG